MIELHTAGDGFDYACRPRRKGGWHCGKCLRGVLHSWDKKCKVCKHPVFKRQRDDTPGSIK